MGAWIVSKKKIVALVPIAVLWGWVLNVADDAGAAAWPMVLIVLVPWVAIDWIASGSGAFAGPKRLPAGTERFLCYLFMGVGLLPFLSAGAGIMPLREFKPAMVPTLFSDGMDVGLLCLFGLIVTSTLRLSGWTDSLFTNSTASAGPGGGGGA